MKNKNCEEYVVARLERFEDICENQKEMILKLSEELNAVESRLNDLSSFTGISPKNNSSVASELSKSLVIIDFS